MHVFSSLEYASHKEEEEEEEDKSKLHGKVTSQHWVYASDYYGHHNYNLNLPYAAPY